MNATLKNSARAIFSALALAALVSSCRTASSRFVLQDKMQAWPDSGLSGGIDPLAAPTWKECLPETYVFLELVGNPDGLGDMMRQLFATAGEAGLQVTGSPFALFYDDPSQVPVDRQRSRVCLPIQPGTRTPAGLRMDRLASRMVAYKQHQGPYTDAPLAIPEVMGFMRERGWHAAGPVREVYLVNPAEVASPNQLVCEVQIPWSQTNGE